MKNRPKSRNYLSLIIVPHSTSGRMLSLKIPVGWVYGSIWGLIILLIVVGSSFIYSTLLSRKLINYAEVIHKNRKQQEIISSFSDKTRKLLEAINELEEKDNELRRVLGLKGWKSKIRLSGDKISWESRSLDIESFKDKLAERKKSLEELKRWVALVRQRFASTPSIWPVYGQISSSFGYRIYPWRGFHRGLDIRAPYGTPVRATASGLVKEVGWIRGYGKTIVLSHGWGVSTLYGHLSGYAVRVGQSIRKGQVIGYVGLTGWTTGSHLHYEVHKWGTAVNPVAYLRLNVFSASRLWSR